MKSIYRVFSSNTNLFFKFDDDDSDGNDFDSSCYDRV